MAELARGHSGEAGRCFADAWDINVSAGMVGTVRQVGILLGLFAIFSVLRYRTSTMSTREMTYLFIIIALPVMNSVLMRSGAWLMLGAVNILVTAVLFVLEREWGFDYESVQTVRYERIELFQPQHRAQLIADLRERTGLPVTRVEVGRLNFLNDTAELRAFYHEARPVSWQRPDESDLLDEGYLLADSPPTRAVRLRSASVGGVTTTALPEPKR